MSLLNNVYVDEDSRHSLDSQASVDSPQSEEEYNAEKVVEYEWPPDSGYYHFVEEYLATFLEIKSLRRTYPLMERRRVMTLQEREYLRGEDIVSELQCDLGVVALASLDVYKTIVPDFVRKFAVYDRMKKFREYETTVQNVWKEKHYNIDHSNDRLAEQLRKTCVKACVDFNKEKRMGAPRRCMDLQTGIIQKRRKCDVDYQKNSRVGYFPVAVLPGQYIDYWRRFTPEELKSFPLNTATVLPVEKPIPIPAKPTDVVPKTDKKKQVSADIRSKVFKMLRLPLPSKSPKFKDIADEDEVARPCTLGTSTDCSDSSESLFELVGIRKPIRKRRHSD